MATLATTRVSIFNFSELSVTPRSVSYWLNALGATFA